MGKISGSSAGGGTVVALGKGHRLFSGRAIPFTDKSHSIGSLYEADKGLAWAAGFLAAFCDLGSPGMPGR